MAFGAKEKSIREMKLEHRLRTLSKNLEVAEQKITELKNSLQVSKASSEQTLRRLKDAMGKSHLLDELLIELKVLQFFDSTPSASRLK